MHTLHQARNAHRFSTDALLLAQFTPLEKINFFAELGTGCGVIALELLKRKPAMQALALDYNKELLESAKENALLYACEKNIAFVEEDLRNFPKVHNTITKDFQNSCELVVCNPPWLLENQGKLPKDEIKRNALFGDKHTYNTFFRAARYFLKERGLLSFVTIPERVEHSFSALSANTFVLKKIQFVHKSVDREAIFMLVLAELKGKKASSHISNLIVGKPYFLD